MVFRCARALLPVAMLLGVFFSWTIMASASPATPHDGFPALLQDEPLLPDDLTPDNDGDAVVDDQDSAPDDPNEGAAPEPGSNDPVADGDNDGLPNTLDPDDDSDGIVDDEDLVGSDDSVPPPPVSNPAPPPTGDPYPAPEPDFTEAVPSGSIAEQPVVLALPSTGSGAAPGLIGIPGMLIGASLLLAIGCTMHGKRR